MKTVLIPQNLTEVEFDLVLKESTCEHVERTVLFDFSRTTFVSSFAMVLFILLCEDLIYRQYRKVVFKFNKSGRECACMFILARLGLFDCLPSEIKYYPYKPPRKVTRGSNNSILEVTEIKSKEDAINKIDLVESAIVNNTNYSRSQVLDICIMVSEMLQNILSHSEARRHGLISIQRYPNIQNMQLVIADSGLGIPETIRTAKEFKERVLTDEEAILESVKKGVSRFGKGADRGEGLSRCLQLSAKHQAKLYIRSNRGIAFFSFQRKQKFSSSGQLLKGTQIFVNFPMID